MYRTPTKRTDMLVASIAALAIALAAVFLTAPAAPALADEGAGGLTAAPLSAQADDNQYRLKLSGVPDNGFYGIYGRPGERFAIKAGVTYGDPYTFEDVTVKGATFKWTKVSSNLKAAAKGKSFVVSKLPKAGTYKFTLTAYGKDGKKLVSKRYKIVVADRPNVKIKPMSMGEDTVFDLDGASFGWDNNTKKPFYVWAIQNLATKKTSIYDSNRGPVQNDAELDVLSGIAGGGAPCLMTRFSQPGRYKIAAALYHSNKRMLTVYTTYTV